MPILNYTTKVPAARTASEVQALLVGAGARGVAFEYGEADTIIGMRFAMPTPYGLRTFRLPINAQGVEETLEEQKVSRSLRTPEHAEKVAWRIIKDWIEAQLAIIQSRMVTLDEVMFPYMEEPDTGITAYAHYVASQRAIEQGRAG